MDKCLKFQDSAKYILGWHRAGKGKGEVSGFEDLEKKKKNQQRIKSCKMFKIHFKTHLSGYFMNIYLGSDSRIKIQWNC